MSEPAPHAVRSGQRLGLFKTSTTSIARSSARHASHPLLYWNAGGETQTSTPQLPKGRGSRRVQSQRRPADAYQLHQASAAEELLNDNEVRNAMKVRAGDPLNLIALDSSIAFLKAALWDKGYGDGDARVDTIVVDTATKSASIQASVDPKWPTTIGRISISGNERVSERTIRNSLTLKEGRLYKRHELTTSQRNLYESNLFRRAVIIVPPQGDSVKHIEITYRRRRCARFARARLPYARFRPSRRPPDEIQLAWWGRRLDSAARWGTVGQHVERAVPVPEVLRRPVEDQEADSTSPRRGGERGFHQPWFLSPRNARRSAFSHRRSAPASRGERPRREGTFTRMLATRAPVSLPIGRAHARRGERLSTSRDFASAIRATSPHFGRARSSPAGALFRDRSRRRSTRSFARVFRAGGFRARVGLHLSTIVHGFPVRPALQAFGSPCRARVAGAGRVGARCRARRKRCSARRRPPTRFCTRASVLAGGSQSCAATARTSSVPASTVDPGKLLNAPNDTTPRCARSRSCWPAIVTGGSLPSSDFERVTWRSTLLEGRVDTVRTLAGASTWPFTMRRSWVKGRLDSHPRHERGHARLRIPHTTPVGPIRIELGIKPRLAENLPIVTEVIEDGVRRIVPLRRRGYDPLEDSKSGLRQVSTG